MKPGYNDPKVLTWEHSDQKLIKQTAEFVKKHYQKKENEFCLDIGRQNAKTLYIERLLDINFTQYVVEDLNKETKDYYNPKMCDLITCFETLEHLQNPLTLMWTIEKLLAKDGVLFVSMPARPRFLWTEHHFHEMKPAHFQKWILDECGLKIVAQDRIRINMPLWKHFTGLRPFLRLFYNYTVIYKIVRK